MGIQHLNTYIKEKCNHHDAIKTITFNELKGKRIVIDTSIYLYKYSAEGALIDNMYQMIALFKSNGIIPLFVFDGKPPPEKYKLLQSRKEERLVAENKYKELQEKLAEITDYDEKKEMNNELDTLRRTFVKINYNDIENVKKLMDLSGVHYCIAEGEADQLCAKLVLNKSVYACLSDDMDLFVYGCPRILRGLSLLKSTVVMYDFKKVLDCLHISIDDFRKICVISGTDYNYVSGRNKNINLYKTMHYYEKFIQHEGKDFYEWLRENTTYIEDYDAIKEIEAMFDLQDLDITKYNLQKITLKSVFKEPLHKFLEDYNFIFV